MTNAVFTVGHSTHTLQNFLSLLKLNAIEAVGDVRSSPYSRVNPQFNREALRNSLKAEGLEYVFLGKELGARSDDLDCYVNDQVQYQRLAKTPLFCAGIERVKQGAKRFRIALMCAEKEPLECHRTILVARQLCEEGVAVYHILGDGRTETHHQTLERLIDRLKIQRTDMFRAEHSAFDDAYARQAAQIAYRRS